MSEVPAEARRLLRVDHLCKRYGDSTVVDDLSFSIAPGECLGVIGPNGAGKTTTIRMCLGLSTPDSGSIRYALQEVAPGESAAPDAARLRGFSATRP